MKVSAAGRRLIEKFEGLRLDAYPDPATGGDPWTIGYGDTGPDVVPGLRITKEEADRRLSERLAREFEPAVNRAISGTRAVGRPGTTQGQFDAMVSLVYNIGVAAFLGSSVARNHAAGNYASAAAAFMLWNKADHRVLPALTRRRGEERALYETQVNRPPLRPAIDRVKAIQTILGEGDLYTAKIDGDFGTLSQTALDGLVHLANAERV